MNVFSKTMIQPLPISIKQHLWSNTLISDAANSCGTNIKDHSVDSWRGMPTIDGTLLSTASDGWIWGIRIVLLTHRYTRWWWLRTKNARRWCLRMASLDRWQQTTTSAVDEGRSYWKKAITTTNKQTNKQTHKQPTTTTSTTTTKNDHDDDHDDDDYDNDNDDNNQ